MICALFRPVRAAVLCLTIGIGLAGCVPTGMTAAQADALSIEGCADASLCY